MTPWRFKGAKLNACRTEQFQKEQVRGYLAGGWGEGDGCGAAGALAVEPEVVGWAVGGAAAAAACGWAAGLIQQP